METNTVQASPLVQPSKSGLGIAGFVLGIIALATSFLPIINNFSALLAAIGFVLALIGMIACVKGRKSGKGLSIARRGDERHRIRRGAGHAKHVQLRYR